MNDFSQGTAWMNGEIIPISHAKIHVTDWGLTHSDIAYDVVPVRDRAFFRLGDYLDRFMATCAAWRFAPGLTRDHIEAALHKMVAASGLESAYVAMVVARGRNPVPGSRDPRDCENHFYAWCVPYVHVVKPEIAKSGASIWVAKNARRIPKECVNPRAKNYHWGDFTTGLFEAKDKGFETTMLLDLHDNVTEGPGFNVFALYGDKIVTPSEGVLHGITRKTVIEMSLQAGFEVETRALPFKEFVDADEVFLSSSAGGVVPVTKVDARHFSNGAPGPVAEALRETYFEWMARPELSTPVAQIS